MEPSRSRRPALNARLLLPLVTRSRPGRLLATGPAHGRGDGALLASAGLLVMSTPIFALAARGLVPLALVMLAGAAVLAWTAWQRPRPGGDSELSVVARPWFLAVLAVQGGLQVWVLLASSNAVVRILVTVGYVLGAGTAATARKLRWVPPLTATRLFVLGQAAVLAWLIPGFPQVMDVWVFLTDGARALLHGVNPYTLTFSDVYSPGQASVFYGHGVVVHGHLTYGFPYLPVSALWAAPGYLLGDVRIAGVIGLAALAWVLSGPRVDQRSRATAVLLVAAPSTLAVLSNSWIEPSLVVLLGLAVWAMRTGRLTLAAVGLGLFLVSKQYLVVVTPCLWLLRPLATRRHVAVVAGSAAAATVPFVLANPHAFWRSVVQWQLAQPFRRDSLSLLVAAVNHFGWPSPAVYNLLPVVAGLLAAVVFSLTARPGPATFATGVALALLTTVLLSKQAFLNYYYLVGAALLIAAWAASAPQTPTPGALTGSYAASSAPFVDGGTRSTGTSAAPAT